MALPKPPRNIGATTVGQQHAGEEHAVEDKYADIGQATARDGLALIPTKVLKLLHLV